jgi:hypothetical protein
VCLGVHIVLDACLDVCMFETYVVQELLWLLELLE